MSDIERLNQSAHRLRNIRSQYARLHDECDDEARFVVGLAINAAVPDGWKLGGANVECVWWKHRGGATVKLLPKAVGAGEFIFWRPGERSLGSWICVTRRPR